MREELSDRWRTEDSDGCVRRSEEELERESEGAREEQGEGRVR